MSYLSEPQPRPHETQIPTHLLLHSHIIDFTISVISPTLTIPSNPRIFALFPQYPRYIPFYKHDTTRTSPHDERSMSSLSFFHLNAHYNTLRTAHTRFIGHGKARVMWGGREGGWEHELSCNFLRLKVGFVPRITRRMGMGVGVKAPIVPVSD